MVHPLLGDHKQKALYHNKCISIIARSNKHKACCDEDRVCGGGVVVLLRLARSRDATLTLRESTQSAWVHVHNTERKIEYFSILVSINVKHYWAELTQGILFITNELCSI